MRERQPEPQTETDRKRPEYTATEKVVFKQTSLTHESATHLHYRPWL